MDAATLREHISRGTLCERRDGPQCCGLGRGHDLPHEDAAGFGETYKWWTP
jgi:hypothetical protein